MGLRLVLMDPLALLAAVIAIAVYPGGLYTLALAQAAHRGWTGTRAVSVGIDEALAVALALVAASLLPLPGSPAQTLPPQGGAGGNLAAVIVFLAAALGVAGGDRWRWRRITAALAALAPLLCLAAGTASLGLAPLVTYPGAAMSTARVLAALTLALLVPSVVGAPRRAEAPPGRAVLAATAALLALSLVMPHPASALGALAGALGAGLTVTAYSVLVRLWGHALVEPQPAVLAAAGGCAAAACALALVGGHG